MLKLHNLLHSLFEYLIADAYLLIEYFDNAVVNELTVHKIHPRIKMEFPLCLDPILMSLLHRNSSLENVQLPGYLHQNDLIYA